MKTKNQEKKEQRNDYHFKGMIHSAATNSWNYVANKQHEMNRRQPVKVFTKEEIEAYKKSKGI
jgi:hypothetical protein